MNRQYAKAVRITLVGLLLFIIMAVCLGCSAGGNPSEEKEKAEEGSKRINLTERQIAILESEGLPTNPEELESHQFSAIMEIEKRLSYMDEKYGGEHQYDSYIEAGIMNKAELKCYEKNNPIRIITVWEEDDEYHDDYVKQVASEIYTEYLNSYLKENYGEKYFAIGGLVNSFNGEATLESILEQAQVRYTISFYESDCDGTELERRTKALLEWIDPENNGIFGIYETEIMPDDFFDGINEYNNSKKREEIWKRMGDSKQLVIYEGGTWAILD